MSGDQLVARIRKLIPHQRIVMATAYVEEYKVFGQPEAAIDALLLKPFTFQALQDAIEMVLLPETRNDLREISPVTETSQPEPPDSGRRTKP
jgi:CheY-like chemotaxis protein